MLNFDEIEDCFPKRGALCATAGLGVTLKEVQIDNIYLVCSSSICDGSFW